jgi:hypothetical protein
VESLTATSDVVLFSAALPGQGGRNHVNERLHSYWAGEFASRGYAVFDAFRPVFWTDGRVEPWYRQNAFLYIKRSHALCGILSGAGISEMQNRSFMDCIHPWMYEAAKAPHPVTFKQHCMDFLPSFVRAIRFRLPR